MWLLLSYRITNGKNRISEEEDNNEDNGEDDGGKDHGGKDDSSEDDSGEDDCSSESGEESSDFDKSGTSFYQLLLLFLN